ncbi:hypothetical protein VPH35_100718 [Triticum aestivum]
MVLHVYLLTADGYGWFACSIVLCTLLVPCMLIILFLICVVSYVVPACNLFESRRDFLSDMYPMNLAWRLGCQ